MRYTCDIEGLEHAFVEFSDAWTRGEYRALGSTDDGDAWLALLRSKIVAVCLPCLKGDDIDDPTQLTEEDFDRVDIRAFQWFSNMPWLFRAEIANQGEVLRRRLYGITAAALTPNNHQEPEKELA